MRLTQQKGFTLIEMIIVIVITGIIAGIVSTFISRPIEGYIGLSQRATLVYNAENALRRMQRDIRLALPNSVRINSSATALELLSTLDGMRYRTRPPGGDASRLSFTEADSEFDVFGNFTELGTLPFTSSTARIAIYNIGANNFATNPPTPIAGANAYAGVNSAGTNVITPAGTSISITTSGSEDHITINPPFRFTFESPQQRMFIVDTPVSYICDTTAGTLTRYDNYSIQSAQPVPPATTGTLLAENIQSCSFSYQPGTTQRAGIVSLSLRLQTPASSERIQILHQMHVDNVP